MTTIKVQLYNHTNCDTVRVCKMSSNYYFNWFMTRSEALFTFKTANVRGDHRRALKRGRFHYVTCPHHLSELTAPLRKQLRALTISPRLWF